MAGCALLWASFLLCCLFCEGTKNLTQGAFSPSRDVTQSDKKNSSNHQTVSNLNQHVENYVLGFQTFSSSLDLDQSEKKNLSILQTVLSDLAGEKNISSTGIKTFSPGDLNQRAKNNSTGTLVKEEQRNPNATRIAERSDISDEAYLSTHKNPAVDPPLSSEPSRASPESLVHVGTRPLVDQALEKTPQCQDTFTEYAHMRNLCGAHDEYSSHILFSCAGQCESHSTAYHSDKTKKCFCDFRCITFDDCCLDMNTSCPETYAKSKKVHSFLMGAKVICQGPHYFSFISQQGAAPIHKQVSSTTLSVISSMSPTSYDSNSFYESVQLGFPIRLDSYKTADIELGVLFSEYLSFASWKIPFYRLGFVPNVVSYICFSNHMIGTVYISATRLLVECLIEETKEVLTRYHRLCPRREKIKCACAAQSETIFQSCYRPYNRSSLLTNSSASSSCELVSADRLGEEPSLANLVSVNRVRMKITPVISPQLEAQLTLDQAQPGYAESSTAKLSSLTTATTGATSEATTVATTAATTYAFGISIHGASEDFTDVGRFESAQIPDNVTWKVAIPSELDNDEKPIHRLDFIKGVKDTFDIRDLKSQEHVHYLLDLNGTVESRIRCSTLRNFPLNCQLEQCVDGAVLVNEPVSALSIGNRSCILPVSVHVTQHEASPVPQVCLCWRVLAAFIDLEIWDVTADNVRAEKQCYLVLKMKNSNTPEMGQTEEYTDIQPFVTEGSTQHSPVSLSSISLATLRMRIKDSLLKTRYMCGSHKKEDHIHVCFRYLESGKTTVAAEPVCIEFLPGSSMFTRSFQRNSAPTLHAAVADLTLL
ncbi:hypothetical protein EGW08_014484 [Elysia chlorotica]|uniref:SMB domain-containing protein n=1 Tax=Elysia chlorotica TaxID=188477 RepID=A0A3S1B8Q4_ELYCH|nr:hypothetical protein EGW08_014484 [Elysia chlorotica]